MCFSLLWCGAVCAVLEFVGLTAETVGRRLGARQGWGALLDDTLFFSQLPDIYFENLHHASGALTEKNKAQRGELYNLIIATNGLLPIATSFFRQIVEQLWPHLNPNDGVLVMIERGTQIGFKAIAYTRSTILKDYIKNIGEAFQSLPATNADGSANPPIEKGPGATIAPRTNHEECLIFCCSSQHYESPGYLQRLMDESSKNREDP
ncbi:hypothetical protein HOY80DRAFT_941416, partial [Tuber brumale]